MTPTEKECREAGEGGIEMKSRSVLRRIAIQKGKPMPEFDKYGKVKNAEAEAISKDADREMIGDDCDFLEDIGNK